MARSTPSRLSVRIFAWAFLIALPISLVGAAELAANVYMNWRYHVPGHAYGIYKSHPLLGGILAENGFNSSKITNNFAFLRADDIGLDKPAGAKRVIAYGGSTTYCYNLALGEEWPARLEAIAIARGTKLQVLNAGDISWSSGHINVRTREEVPRLKPDYVIFYEGINEEDNLNRLRAEGVDVAREIAAGRSGLYNRSIVQAQWLYRNSMLFKAYHQWFAAAGGENTGAGPSPEPDPLAREHFCRTLLAMIQFWKQQGAQPIFVIQASVDAKQPFLARITSYSRDFAAEAGQAGAIVIDGQEVVRRYDGNAGDLFYSTGVHWSALGAEKFAGYIFEQVRALNGWR